MLRTRIDPMDSDSKYKSTLAFTDLLFNVLIGFAFLFIIAFILINPVNKRADIKSKAEFMVIMDWDPNSLFDIDLWMQDPSGTIVGFPNKDSGWTHLDRDDLGQANDMIYVNDMESRIVKINREIMTVRGVIPGEYIVNIHFYSAKSAQRISPVDVSIQAVKINPYEEIFNDILTLEKPSDEKTAIRFKVDDEGKVIYKSKLRKNLAGKVFEETGLYHSQHVPEFNYLPTGDK